MAITPDEKGPDALVRQFEAENPGIQVRLLNMGAGGMNPQKLMTAIVGGAPPDVVRQDRFTIADWASRGAFTPLDPLIERDKQSDPRTPLPDQYYPAAWSEAQYHGTLYGIPIGADNRILYWNPEIFRSESKKLQKAGLDPNRPPQSWTELLAYSRALTEFNPDGTIKRAGFIPNWGNSWLYLYAFQNGAEFISPDGKHCTLTNPHAVQALQFMVDGYEVLGGFENALKFQSGFRVNELDPFAIGQVAMVINGDWTLAHYARYSPDFKFQTAPAPVPDDRLNHRGRFANEPHTFTTWSGGYSWVIPRGAKHREAAWKFIKWITCLEGRQLNIRSQADLEQARGRRYIPRMEAHVQANQWLIENFASGQSVYEQAMRNHVAIMPAAKVRPATFAGQKLWDEHVRATEQAARKTLTPFQALKAGEESVQVVLDEFHQKDNLPTFDIPLPLGILFVGTVLALVVWIALMVRRGESRVSNQETSAGYLFLSPWILGFLIFTLGPMLASLLFSFLQYDVLNPPHWVGLKNYQDLFVTDRAIVLKSFENVGYLAIIGIPLGLATGLGVAMLLNTAVRGLRFYRTAFYLPSIAPTVAATFLWMWILVPDPNLGLLNKAWSLTITPWFGIPGPGWLNVEAWARPAIIVMGLWGAGGGMILWLAGLKGIPQTLYEAASIDGASPWHQFVRVTLPQLSPLIFFTTVIGFIQVLQTFDGIYIITRGESLGPGDTLATPVYLLFNNGFTYFRMGYASAMAWLIFVIVLLVTFIQFKVAPKWVSEERD